LAPLVYVLAGGMLWSTERVTVVAIMAMSALLAWRHQENISRLVQGKESRLGKSKEAAAAAAVPAAANRKHRKRH
jgi:glycerol-3-phosphate acyltransferase PlsY